MLPEKRLFSGTTCKLCVWSRDEKLCVFISTGLGFVVIWLPLCDLYFSKCPCFFCNNSVNLLIEQSIVEWNHLFLSVLIVLPAVNRGIFFFFQESHLTDFFISSTPVILTLWIWCTSVSHNKEKSWNELTRRRSLSP